MDAAKLKTMFPFLPKADAKKQAAALKVLSPADNADFCPVVRFLVCSDAHVDGRDDESCKRLQTMLRLGYAVADAAKTYRRLDAVMCVGDLTGRGKPVQFQAFYDAVAAVKRRETKLLCVLARAHDGWTMTRAQTHALWQSLSGLSPDFHVCVGGFHVIGVSASKNDQLIYDDGQIAWLRRELERATKDDPKKPVFVLHHEHIRDTVYGSSAFDGWGETFFAGVLRDFPQVVDLSGHSHYPLNDPRSVWQGAYTAIGTGAIRYAEFTVDDVRTYHPEGNDAVATCWIVELDKACRLRLRGVDILAQQVLCDDVLDNPADPQNRAYTPEKRAAASKPPVFAPGAAIKTEPTETGVALTVPAAASVDGTPVVLYRAAAFDEAGAEKAKTWTLPRYYTAQPEKAVTLHLELQQHGVYTVRVTAETAWGVQSAPLEAKICI